MPCISIHASIDNAIAPATCSPSHCQNGRYVARVPIIADIIMLRFTACLLSAALPGSLLSFEIIYSHCQINSLRFSFQCPFLRHLRFWKLIYPVWHAVYEKSASKFDSYHNHLPVTIVWIMVVRSYFSFFITPVLFVYERF